MLLAVWSVGMGTAVAQQGPPSGSEPGDLQILAERHAPILVLKQQAEECDDEGEPYGPTSVDIVLDNPEVALRQVSIDNPVLRWAPGAADLAGLGEGFFLDFPGSSLEPGCTYERDFRKYAAGAQPLVYAHVVQQPDEPDRLFVQYWFYWYFNDWNNKHESDWEGITLAFEASSVEEALASGPVAVGYAQHEGGERADWDDPKLEREGDRPVVYSSAGSHASYFGSAVYLGRSASEGFGCDDTDGPSVRIAPDVVLLPDAVEDSGDPLAWLSFEGRWGERQRGAFNGPTGPAVKDRWLAPAPWFEELRPSSVVIPAGDSVAGEVIDVFCGAVERGSGALIGFTVTPGRMLIGLALAWISVSFLARRTDWRRVPLAPIRRRRRTGQIMRAAGRIYADAPLDYLALGLLYVPIALATGVLAGMIEFVPFVAALRSLAGAASGTNLFLAVFAGSLTQVVAFVVVNGMIAVHLERGESGPRAAMRSARRTWNCRRELAGALVRAIVVVVGLLATVVGAPWGVRQLVRYQFAPQAVMLEDAGGAAALDRSSDLVRGRWLRTAAVIAVLNSMIALGGLVAALVVLVVASGLPLWFFSALVSMMYALIAPVAGIAMTLLYGDAAAAEVADADEAIAVTAAVH